MKLSDKEKELIKSGKIHAVLRWEKPEDKVGDVLFDVGGIVYKLKEKKRWAVFRCGAQRSSIDWGCEDIQKFKSTMEYLYGGYAKIKKDIVYLCVLEVEKKQRTLGV